MREWVFSTEPATFPWSRVQEEGGACWDGIRGSRARKNLASVEPGDRIWGYHSSPEKALVCWARARAKAFPDPTDNRWLAIEVEFDQWLRPPIPLAALRNHPVVASMDFLRIPRLSVAPLTDHEARALRELLEEKEEVLE